MRILRPGNPIPGDVRPFVNKHPEMLERVCALIEFERTEFAMKAVRTLNSEAEDHMKVALWRKICNFRKFQIGVVICVTR